MTNILLRKVDTMKILKLSVVFITILGILVGFRVFALQEKKVISSNTAFDGSEALSAENLKPSSQLDSDNNKTTEGTSESTLTQAPSESTSTKVKTPTALDLNRTFESCHSSPTEVDTETGATSKASIYGKNLSLIPTEVLVNKADISDKEYSAKFMGIVINFKPMIIVTGLSEKTKITFDLSAFEFADGKFDIVDNSSQAVISSFTGKKGLTEVQFAVNKTGGYSIIKNNYTLGIIEVVDAVESADLDNIRSKYIE